MNIKSLFKAKPVEQIIKDAKQAKLARTLGPMQLILLGIGAIIGSGIFVLTGAIASQCAGPSVVLSFIIGGIACICAAFCYAELASTIPVSGGAYAYINAGLGELPAYIGAGFLLMGNVLSVASVASGWSGYFTSILTDFGINFPQQFANSTGTIYKMQDGSFSTAIINIPSILITLLLAGFLCIGMQESLVINTVIVFFKMIALIAFVVVGAFYVDIDKLTPFIPENSGNFGEFGVSGVIAGASMAFLAYNGFDNVAIASQEAKNPKKDVPIGIIGSIAIVIVSYVCVSGVLVGIVDYKDLNVSQPLAVAVDKIGIPWFGFFIKFGILAALTSVLLVMTYGIARVILMMSQDGLLPKSLKKVHPKYKTPHIATIVVGFIVALLSSTLSIAKIAQLANLGILITFAIVCLALLFLRRREPHLKRDFSCPFMPFTPIIGIILLLCIIIIGMPISVYLFAGIFFITLVAFYIFSIYMREYSSAKK